MLFLALRHLVSRPQQTLLTFVGISLGAAAYIIFSAIMLGFQEVILDQLINNDAQVRISPRDTVITEESFRGVFFGDYEVRWLRPPSGKTNSQYLSNVHGWFEKLAAEPLVEAFAPQLKRQVTLVKGRNSAPASLTGIIPEKQSQITTIEKYIFGASLADLNHGEGLLVLGDGLLGRLGLREGESVQVLSPGGGLRPARVIGVLRSGNRFLDDTVAYASLRTVQSLTSSAGEISDIAVRLKDAQLAAVLAERWAQFTHDKVESWDMVNRNTLSVFRTQDIMRNSITFVITLIVAFGIYNILNMVVNQKKKEIAILRSTGYDRSDTIRLFMIQGIILAVAGIIAGSLVGYISSKALETIKIVEGDAHTPPRYFMISYNIMIYLKAAILTLTSAVLASYLPARAAGKLSPIEIIRGS